MKFGGDTEDFDENRSTLASWWSWLSSAKISISAATITDNEVSRHVAEEDTLGDAWQLPGYTEETRRSNSPTVRQLKRRVGQTWYGLIWVDLCLLGLAPKLSWVVLGSMLGH